MSTANDTIVDIGSSLEAHITKLTPGKVYKLRVLAYSNGGDGRMSSPAHTFQMGKILNTFNTYLNKVNLINDLKTSALLIITIK